ncbi:MAG TPA: FAD-dependent oxidoreductase [Streptosporangiaceae bacterium]|nr:FAD-dependent oxidoreductase [Streptosporangiaceae bacterium]
MAAEPAFVIVGASLAGAKAAETLRAEGFGGDIVLLGQETELPYERPPLSKGLLLGKDEKSSIYVHDAAWYQENAVDLRTGVTVTGVDAAQHEVRTDGGATVAYRKLLLATGSSPRRLRCPGGDLDGVLYLRQVEDSERLRSALSDGAQVVVVGAGWIGLEVTAAAREAGCDVTVVEPEPTALHRQLGPELGAVFTALHIDHGVTFRFGETVTELLGSGGRVTQAVTSSGARLPADVVVVGIGAVPNTALAEEAGLEVRDGVVADAALRTTDPDVFVAGDIARYYHPLYDQQIRVEHWANALTGGPVAAKSMLGQRVAHDGVPYFFSDQYDLGMETAGLPEPGSYDRVVYRGDRDRREFIAFWLKGGVLVAGMNVNWWDVNEDIQSMVRARREPDADRLADPDVPLSEL